jgi:DNA helicase-2/ATP-dependent DNA helicase PcrA
MLDNLTESQRLAVEHTEGPLLILAGAGTGKTRTLTYRIAHLIERGLVQPEQIMAVTFTRKAAAEMAGRFETLLSEHSGARKIRLGTFHAISASLLRDSHETIVDLELLPETDQIDLIKKILQEKDISSPDWQPLEVLRKISLAKNNLLSPEALVQENDRQLAEVYRLYQQTLLDHRLLDFDDLIGRMVYLWEEDPAVLARHQNSFKFILVDEFQDVNAAQYRWLKLLTATHRNLCVVGDTDQSIYGFRGSHVRIFQRFQEDFPEVRIVKLEQNFRSSQNIMEAAAGVIGHNHNPLTCKLWSDSKPGPLLRRSQVADEGQEAHFIVTEIERLVGGSSHYQLYQGSDLDSLEENRFGFGESAVLYRTHAQSRPIADALSSAGIPFQLVGEKAPFATPAADALLSYLRFAMDTSRVEDLRSILNLPPRGLGDKAQQWLDEEIGRGMNSGEILRQACRNVDLPVRYQAAMDHLWRTIVSLRDLAAHQPLSELLARAWEDTGLRQHFEDHGGSVAESLKWLRLLARAHGNQSATETLSLFLDDLDQWRTGDFHDPRADAVTLMTMHAAKGLEFPVVFLCGLDQNLLPLARKDQGEETLEEERRLFYVAMTRAEYLLVLSTVRKRFLYGEHLSCQPSPFLKEIPSHLLEEISLPTPKKKPRKDKQLTLF